MKASTVHKLKAMLVLTTVMVGMCINVRPARAQAFSALYSFQANTVTPSDGFYPKAALVLYGGNLYGTTAVGGADASLGGTVFSIGTEGSGYKILHSFVSGTDGASPEGQLVLANSTLYGTTGGGGPNGSGTIYSMGLDGSNFTVLYPFSARGSGNVNADGANPHRLYLSGSVLYGTTGTGGAYGQGTIFSIGTNGSGFAVLHHFTALTENAAGGLGTNSDGINPGALVISGNTLYGNAYGGGTNGWGTLFSVNTDTAEFKVLHAFSGRTGSTNWDGAQPAGDLALSGNMLYGTTVTAGPNRYGTAYSVGTDGSAFAVLHAFGVNEGSIPYGGLMLAGNTLYGMANHGGSGNNGSVFSLNTDGSDFNVLYNFTAFPGGNNTNTDGAWPYAGLVLGGNRLYGTAEMGGPVAAGTVFGITILPRPRISLTASNTVVIEFTGQADAGYYLEYRDSLTSGSWQLLYVLDPVATVHDVALVDPVVSISAGRFYRVRTTK